MEKWPCVVTVISPFLQRLNASSNVISKSMTGIDLAKTITNLSLRDSQSKPS